VPAVEATLYSIAISHPSRAAALMLAHKGIEAKIVNLPPGSQQVAMRALGFRGGTVPGLRIDGRRILGSTAIARALDELVPEPPLYPSDPELRAAVEEAERWGDAVYQPVPRRVFRWSVATNQESRSRLAKAMGVPAPELSSRLLWPVAQIYVRFEGGGEDTARADVAALPGHLSHVDELIAAGTLDGPELNAADFQIATTTRVLLNFASLRHLVAGRPAEAHAHRVVPRFGREVPVDVPSEWIPARA
jgi:glutathione S-transferase